MRSFIKGFISSDFFKTVTQELAKWVARLLVFVVLILMILVFGPLLSLQLRRALIALGEPAFQTQVAEALSDQFPTNTQTPMPDPGLETIAAAHTRVSLLTIEAGARETLIAQGVWTPLPTTPTPTPTITLTPTLTLTPTVASTATQNLTATVEYRMTEDARSAQVAGAVLATRGAIATLAAQATLDVPTNTPVPTEPPIPLGFPGNPVTSNSQWTPTSQSFNGVEMVLVPAGCFMMGSDSGDADERPVHQVCFEEPFWIDRYEVTNEQFARIGGQARAEGVWTEADVPRQRVTWFEARDFCTLRGTRLPTEAEWEYAARGPDSLIYPWGNAFVPDNVVYLDNSYRLEPVSSRPDGASWVGALHMSGNALEWTSSINRPDIFPYPYRRDDGRESEDDLYELRTARGGSFVYREDGLRSATRFRQSPTYTDNGYGFRCAAFGEGQELAAAT